MNPIPAQANIRTWDAIARADGTPVTTGTVNFYLVALTGANAGKWFRGSDSSWQASESVAGAMTHRSDGHWYVSIVAGAWTAQVEYEEYGKESGNLHVPYSSLARCETPQTGDSFARLGTPAGASIAADVAAAKSDTTAILTDTGTDGVVVAAASKAGYALSATGLDSVSTTIPTGAVSTWNFRERILMVFRRLFGKATMTSTQFKSYAANGTTVLSTQTVADDGVTQTQGEAS